MKYVLNEIKIVYLFNENFNVKADQCVFLFIKNIILANVKYIKFNGSSKLSILGGRNK